MGKMDWSSDRPGKGNVSDTVRNFRRRRGLFEVHRIIYSDVLPPAVVATRSRPTWWLATRRDGAKLRAVSSAIAVNPLIVERSRLGQRELLLPFFFSLRVWNLLLEYPFYSPLGRRGISLSNREREKERRSCLLDLRAQIESQLRSNLFRV